MQKVEKFGAADMNRISDLKFNFAKRKHLFITLGHGSSAVMFDERNKKVIGYEQERIDGMKSSSQFPTDAINEIIKHVGVDGISGSRVYISHWFNINGRETTKNWLESKYVDLECLNSLKKLGCEFYTLDETFSHHDAHACASNAFFAEHAFDSKSNNAFKMMKNDEFISYIVADGFGNNNEAVSIYKMSVSEFKRGGYRPQLIARKTGMTCSLGILYQTATSVAGMVENQDEYKFLGYESHALEVLDDNQIVCIRAHAKGLTELLFVEPNKLSLSKSLQLNELFDAYSLDNAKSMFSSRFEHMIRATGVKGEFQTRVAIAHMVQKAVEDYIKELIKQYDMKHVVLSGGVFYNVKLNNTVLENTTGVFCAYPLAGDQGAAIGLYTGTMDIQQNEPFVFGNLCWGKRSLYAAEKIKGAEIIDGKHPIESITRIAEMVAKGEIVNLVQKEMEFGPRALCHTSTICIPTKENAEYINHINARNEVMPFAPVMTSGAAVGYFDNSEMQRVIGSDKFMIVTHRYKNKPTFITEGVMHKLPFEAAYTGRPQIVGPDNILFHVLRHVTRLTGVDILINTSFNAHGFPIVCNTQDIKNSYKVQQQNMTKKVAHLIIIK